MFWKKKVEKIYMAPQHTINGSLLAGWLKMEECKEFLKWLDNLELALKVGVFNSNVTKEELDVRRGEVNAILKMKALVNDIRNAKPQSDETEETNG
jgi:hypothetical protein